MWDVFATVGLILCCLAGVVITAVRLPGTWLIVAAALAYGWWDHWARVSLVLVGVLAGIALMGEVIELLTSVLTARKAGASRRAGWGGLIGGIVGMFLFSIPVPIIGTIVGALVGCFVGAMIAELSVRNELGQGAKVGMFSAAGFVLGMVAKLALALVMAGVLVSSLIWSDPVPSGNAAPVEMTAE
ncbi:MAG: DUF456 domain-containing protein [Planctomycetota bacterium]